MVGLGKAHAGAIPALPAPTNALGINDAGAASATTFVFDDDLPYFFSRLRCLNGTASRSNA